MKILFLIDELLVAGGTERHLLDLATGLARAGSQVSVFALASGAFAAAFKEAGLPFRCLNVTRIYGRDGLRAIVELAKYIAAHEIDIVQTFHTGSDLIGPVAATLCRNRPVVLSSRRDLGYTKSPRHIRAQRWVNNLVDRILANSEAVRRSVLAAEGCRQEKTKVIYNGVNARHFSAPNATVVAELRQQLLPAGSRCVIGSVGNIRAEKGYDSMIEVAIAIAREREDVLFLHAGGGEDRDFLQSRCRSAGISDKVIFLGPRRDIPEVLALMDLYFQPSRTEGFSNAILEAMSAGLAVVATRVGGNAEVIQDGVNGFLVEPEDVKGMTAAVMHLVNDRESRKAMGRENRETAISRYDLEGMLTTYERFYHDTYQSLRA